MNRPVHAAIPSSPNLYFCSPEEKTGLKKNPFKYLNRLRLFFATIVEYKSSFISKPDGRAGI